MMENIVMDKAGRKITLRRVGVVEQLRLFKALGPELSLNGPYMDLAIIAASISMINEIPVPFPASEANVETILEKLGTDGVAVVDSVLPAPSLMEMADVAGN